MTVKRTAKEAFGRDNVQLSAFAAAKLRKQDTTPQDVAAEEATVPIDDVAAAVDTSLDVEAHVVSSEPLKPWLVVPSLRYSTASLDRGQSISASGSVEYDLKTDDNLLVLGEYGLEVMDGAVTISGALLRPASGCHTVSAPSTHSLPRITCRTPTAKIRLSSTASSLRGLDDLSPLFRNILASPDHSRSYTVLFRPDDDQLRRNVQALDETPEIQRLLSHFCTKAEAKNDSTLSTVCIGAKSAGKSTLSRMICNALLTRARVERCLYLDLDPGQPEFGPPGQVYLVEVTVPILGPPYTHFAHRSSAHYRLLSAHTLATTSFKDNPGHYYACVKHLFDDENVLRARKQGNCPLVINSCGWINGLGADMLLDILDFGISDAILVAISDQNLAQAIESKVTTCHSLGRHSVRTASRTPAELRQMHTMTYFHHQLQSTSRGFAPFVTTECIARWRPWILAYGGSKPAVAAIISYGQAFNTTFLTEVLEGAVVGIASAKTGETVRFDDHDPSQEQAHASSPARVVGNVVSTDLTHLSPELPHSHLTQGLDPYQYEYHGLGLVRSIDSQLRTIQLLTPLPEAEFATLMQQSVTLIRGAFDNPDWAYLEAFRTRTEAQPPDIAPWVIRQEMIGIEGAVWRLRHPPTMSQLNGRR